jgi:hypothetical protein
LNDAHRNNITLCLSGSHRLFGNESDRHASAGISNKQSYFVQEKYHRSELEACENSCWGAIGSGNQPLGSPACHPMPFTLISGTYYPESVSESLSLSGSHPVFSMFPQPNNCYLGGLFFLTRPVHPDLETLVAVTVRVRKDKLFGHESTGLDRRSQKKVDRFLSAPISLKCSFSWLFRGYIRGSEVAAIAVNMSPLQAH